ncbi:MAG TPA: HAD hydrolase family protein [Methylomirabilota bacterium]|nr:HAD hydrolase family protein [Methylomirabilota bacterium]
MRDKLSRSADAIKQIKLLICDVDGVLTDGRIVYDSSGRELRFFDVQDGLAIRLLRTAGIKTALITHKASRAVKYRAKDMMVNELYAGVFPKHKLLPRLLKTHRVGAHEICYVGDDLVDLGMMNLVGFPVAVANASREVKEAARYVTRKRGGRGAVREVIELILRTQGKWREVVEAVYGRLSTNDKPRSAAPKRRSR